MKWAYRVAGLAELVIDNPPVHSSTNKRLHTAVGKLTLTFVQHLYAYARHQTIRTARSNSI
jgi:hypothetical protein